MDWKDALQNFKDSNPGLPEGSDSHDDAAGDAERVKRVLPRLDIVLDRKGRKGKSATIVCGFASDDDLTLKEVAARLKSRLATGGSARGGEILIQGDRRTDVSRILAKMGYKTRII